MNADDVLTELGAAIPEDDSILVLVLPAGRLRNLFAPPAAQGREFVRDLTVAQYRERFEPSLSESRIRELCAEGVFPDSAGEDGESVPGAYKDGKGEWRITLAGIVARQRHERSEGMRVRAASLSARKRRKADATEPDSPPRPPAKRPRRVSPSAHAPAALKRLREGKWKRVLEEKARE